MRKITIGRGRECDIRIDDLTDAVSRRQAVIKVSPSGKMEIYDTSTNGTFVNGKRIEKPMGVRIRRGDTVNFAGIADLDWNKVKDPYRGIKLMMLAAILFLIVVAACFFIFIYGKESKEPQVENSKEMVVEPEQASFDTLRLQIPEETPVPPPVAPTKKEPPRKDRPQRQDNKPQTREIKPVKESTPEVEKPQKSGLDDALIEQR